MAFRHDFTSNLHYYDNECKCEHCIKDRLNLHAAVAQGAKLLDATEPSWWKKVDVETLSLEGGPDHMVVQILGSPEERDAYAAVRLLLDLRGYDVPAHGLISHHSYYDPSALKWAWTNIILRRHIEEVESW
jgi:hypothetical protein